MSRLLAATIIMVFFITICLPVLLVWDYGGGGEVGPPAASREVDFPGKGGGAGEAAALTLTLWDRARDQLVELDLEEYVTGVTAAEMPASFEVEALKAQAVIARTYALSRLRSRGGQGCASRGGADICSDHNCCQDWITRGDALEYKWAGEPGAGYWDKIVGAVAGTRGEVMLYQGHPVNAVFHSTCGGHTEDSEEVWQASLPYLRAVPCLYCRHSPWSERQFTYSLEEFNRLLNGSSPGIPPAPVEPVFASLHRTAPGRIKHLEINDFSYTGHQLREVLGLPSTGVSWQVGNGQVTLTTRGYGHGVGLCQYGADGMARQGHTYPDILRHYYQGVHLVRAGDI